MSQPTSAAEYYEQRCRSPQQPPWQALSDDARRGFGHAFLQWARAERAVSALESLVRSQDQLAVAVERGRAALRSVQP